MEELRLGSRGAGSRLVSASTHQVALGTFPFLWVQMMGLAEAIAEGSEILGFSPDWPPSPHLLVTGLCSDWSSPVSIGSSLPAASLCLHRSALALGPTPSLITILSAHGPAEVTPKPGPGFVCVEAEFTCCSSPGAGMQGREDRDQSTGYSRLSPAFGAFL